MRFTLLLPLLLALVSCTADMRPAARTSLYVYRFDPPALLEFTPDLEATGAIPFSVPAHCGLFNIFAPPRGRLLAVELSCPNGQTVLLVDTETRTVVQPLRETDSHFLAWAPDGTSLYLKADTLGDTHVARVGRDGSQARLAISPFTYDLAASPNGQELTFALSRGMGQGSELYLTQGDGHPAQQILTDPYSYIALARFSPDGQQIAFLKIPDTPTPYTVGELWVSGTDASNARKLADADAGHGYAASWSPDGQQIAYVGRENALDPRADHSSEALLSNIYLVHVETGISTRLTSMPAGRVETPHWSPDGNLLAFQAVLGDRMEVHIADLRIGEIHVLAAGSVCCPAWVQK